jgi:hypothetical protein
MLDLEEQQRKDPEEDDRLRHAVNGKTLPGDPQWAARLILRSSAA